MADIEKIDGMLYERTAIATKPEELIKQDQQSVPPELTLR